MSDENTQGAERTFKSVNGKSLDGDSEGIRFIRAKALAEAGTTGVVVQGVYEGTLPNKYDESKPDFKIREDNNTLAVLNSTGGLAKQMAKVEIGTYIQVQYLGQRPMESGKMKGKLAHSFVVGIADGE